MSRRHDIEDIDLLLVSALFPPLHTGAGQQAAAVLRQLSGVRCRVLTLGTPDLPAHEERDGLSIDRVGSITAQRPARSFGAAVARRLPFLPRPDLLWVLGVGPATYATIAVGRARRIPVLVKLTLEGQDDAATLGQRRAGRIRLEALRSATLICPSDRLSESALAAGFDPGRVYRIPNGVDLERFAPPGRDARAPREIVFVGAILERKGLHLILDAMEKLLPTYPDLRLTVAGPWIEGRDASHDAYVRDLRARLVGQPLSDCVQVLGAVERPEDVLRRASIFVLPSDAEGLPNALLEAMATAAVPIVTDLPSMREVVDPGISGLLVGERNASSWAEALGRLLSDRALLNRMSAAARDVVTARFGLAAVAEQYRGLFCKSMRGSR